MKGLRLADRVNGSEFCSFERSLLFDQDHKDVGFVAHLGVRSFRLLKSRFTDIDSGRIYVLPQDGSISLDEGSFVSVEIDRLYRDNRLEVRGKESGLFGESTIYAEVGTVSEARIPVPPPDLPVDEFLYRISSSWKDPEDDLLDLVMGLLMVSSPRSILGEGGLGSEGVQLDRAVLKGSNRDLANSILSQLPVEFRTSGTSHYKYSKVENLSDIKLISGVRISENCYSLVPEKIYESLVKRRIPIQLPFAIRNSELRDRKPEIDLDVLDYQLSGLYQPPPAEKHQEETFNEIMRKLKNEEFWDMRSVGSLDRTAGLKISLALSRLFIGKKFDGKGFRASRTDLSEGVDVFRKIMKYGFENIRMKLKEENYFRSIRSEPWREKLRSLDKEVYINLRNYLEEQGLEEMPRDLIMPAFDRYKVDESLERLNKYGYVLFLKGGTIIKPVISIEPEDIK